MNLDPEKLAQAAKKTLLPSRRERQSWLPYSWAVRTLVEKHNARPTVAPMRVLTADGVFQKYPQKEHQSIIECVRVGYYKVKQLPWPEKAKGRKKA